MHSFAERIQKLRGTLDLTQLELGEKINKSENTVYNWEAGNTEPPKNVLKVIAENLGISLTWLGTGKGDMFFEPPPVRKGKDELTEPITVNVLTIASVGHTHYEENHKPIESIQFERSSVTVDGKVFTQAVRAEGDSMHPTIVDRALVGVDFEDKRIIENGLFLISFPDIGIAIKRLQIKKDGVLVVSDNKQVGSEMIPLDILQQGFILGRVRWIHNKV